MNSEKSFLQNQNIAKREKKDNIGNKNREAVDLKRRNFLLGAAATVVAGTTAFKIAEHVFDLGEEKNSLDENQEKNKEVIPEEPVLKKEDSKQPEKAPKPIDEAEEKKKLAEKKASEEEKQKSKEKIKMLIENIIVAHHQIKPSPLWPKDIFAEADLVAQEMVESRLDGSLVSPKGAVGVCQITKIGLKGDLDYLDDLSREKKIKLDHQISLNSTELDMMMNMLREDDDLCRAVRDIHISYLYVKFYKPKGVVEKIASKIKAKEKKKEIHENILAMYSMGEGNFGKLEKDEWPSETKNYIKRNLKYKTKFNLIEKELAKKGQRIRDYKKTGKEILMAEA